MAILPRAAHGDTIPVTKVERAYQGKGEARHEVGSKLTGLLLFDGCAQVPITIPGLDISKLPSPDIVTSRCSFLWPVSGTWRSVTAGATTAP